MHPKATRWWNPRCEWKNETQLTNVQHAGMTGGSGGALVFLLTDHRGRPVHLVDALHSSYAHVTLCFMLCNRFSVTVCTTAHHAECIQSCDHAATSQSNLDLSAFMSLLPRTRLALYADGTFTYRLGQGTQQGTQDSGAYSQWISCVDRLSREANARVIKVRRSR
jgi:hypothetical protein